MVRFHHSAAAAAASVVCVGLCLLLWNTSSSSAFAVIGRDWSSRQMQHSSRQRQPRMSSSSVVVTRLFMAKSRNKQAALKQKLEEAKRQKLVQEKMAITASDDSVDPKMTQQQQQQLRLSDEEIRIRNDRLRFEELLNKGYSSSLGDDSSLNEYLTTRQEEAEIDAVRSGIDRIFEGDPAPEDCFEELVSIKSENAIGETGKQRLVPWLHKNSARHDDYLVIISDPRRQSPELRETVKALLMELPPDIVHRLVFVNADSPAENRRWLKKSNISDEKITLFSDEKMEWMRSYTALGETRWGMAMFVIANRRVQKLARDIDQYGASRTVRNAVKSL